MIASNPMLFEDKHHAATLETLALQALSNRELQQAFAFADRRCRIGPPASVHHYTLRAEISHQMGEPGAAVSDIKRALALAPRDLNANRRMLAWGERPERQAAARILLSIDNEPTGLANALAALRDNGPRALAIAHVFEREVVGWAVWADGHVEIHVDTGERMTRPLTADPAHALREAWGHAASFCVQGDGGDVAIELTIDGESFYRRRLGHKAADSQPGRDFAQSLDLSDRTVTVIVPVYGDFAATKRCLDGLKPQLTREHRAIVVDDASPEAALRDYVRALAEEPFIDCLFNEQNLGFVGAVNRALRRVETGDVLLLNADTVLPPKLITRLAALAEASPDVGTITPLSNNGEFTSFPRANEPNEMDLEGDVVVLDSLAASANAGSLVDIPNGIGFCMYVTRRCLDAIGQLLDRLDRGYLEDVDLCLRAREAGLRNVCAPSIFVGHAGSRSFGSEKRALVVRNLLTIESRFPHYREECASFLVADPLRRYREAIERADVRGPRPHWLICGPGLVRHPVAVRAQQLSRGGVTVVVVQTGIGVNGPVVRFCNPSGEVPQSIAFEVGPHDHVEALKNYAARTRPKRIEIVDPAGVPGLLLDHLRDLEIPFDVLIADAGLVCRRGTMLGSDDEVCAAVNTGRVCGDCGTHRSPAEETDWSKRRQFLVENADHILVPCATAESFASRLSLGRPVTRVDKSAPPRSIRSLREAPRQPALGLMIAGADAAELRLISRVAMCFRRDYPSTQLIVVGTSLDDLGLMKNANVFVAGEITTDEFDRAIRQYGICAIFLPCRRPLFGYPAMNRAEACGLPLAYFDWSFGVVMSQQSDLPLDPRLPADEVGPVLATWWRAAQSLETAPDAATERPPTEMAGRA